MTAPIEGLRPGQSIELLKELHILTRDGKINADTRRKLKQVFHFEGLLRQALSISDQKSAQPRSLKIIDIGAGKSYLGFILYDLFGLLGIELEVWSVESRPELVEKGRALADRLGFGRMHFVRADPQSDTPPSGLPEQVDLVCALHACDTLTDQALDLALKLRVKHVAVVPCCQAEVAEAIRQAPKSVGSEAQALRELWGHSIHRREFASHLTNVLRGLRLEAAGYHVRATELVGWEHSLKNEMIMGELKGDPLPGNQERLKGLLELIEGALGWSAASSPIRKRFGATTF